MDGAGILKSLLLRGQSVRDTARGENVQQKAMGFAFGYEVNHEVGIKVVETHTNTYGYLLYK